MELFQEKLEIISFRQSDGDIMYDCEGKMVYSMKNGKSEYFIFL